jgi:chromosome segregation ATPase
MTDIVERLRDGAKGWENVHEGKLMHHAADEIERLTNALHGKAEALMMQTNEIETLRARVAELEKVRDALNKSNIKMINDKLELNDRIKELEARNAHVEHETNNICCQKQELADQLAACEKERDALLKMCNVMLKQQVVLELK